MNVYEFSLENIEYAGGIMLIAAESREQAEEICKEDYPSKPFRGSWEFSGIMNGLIYNGKKGKVLLNFDYHE